MSGRPCWKTAGILFLLSISSAGCLRVYRSETVWHADGSVDRAIYQDWEATPDPIRRLEAWQQTTRAPDPQELEKQGWSGPISKLPVHRGDEGGSYFAAWGRFKSPQDIPDHVEIGPPKEPAIPNGKLVRDCRWTDYVFVREYRWRETLTDIVNLDDMRQAREELADLLIIVCRDGFHEAYGRDYDASDLVRWLRTEGKTWLAEITDYAFVHSATRKGPSAERALWDGIAAICERHGLVLKAKGNFLDDQALEKAFDDFVVGKICQYVRLRRDRKAPVDRATATAWLAEFKNQNQGKGKLLEPAIERVLAQKYGGKEALDERVFLLIIRIVGLYRILDALRFDYSLAVPEEVVETNGQILATNRVRWQFHGKDAYPLGYSMECRSLASQPQTQRDLLQGQPLDSREAMLAFVSLLADQEPLREALHDCGRQKSMMPLYKYQERTAPAKGEKEVQAASQLLRLLKLPPQPRTSGN